MNKIKIYDELIRAIPKESVLLDEPMKNHTTMKTGGPADIMVIPQSIEEIKWAIQICKQNEAEYFVMGNGSNLLVSDKGMRSIVIKLGNGFSDVSIDGNKIVAQAGVLLSKLSKKIMAASLEGFEFASGIPGTLGGATTMNAGAYGGEMKDVVKSVKVLGSEGQIISIELEDLQFGYRTSIIQSKGYIVLEVELEFEEGDYGEIEKRTEELTVQRTTKQPINLPSCGSVFKRPEGYFAGKLIEDSGLRGKKIGGAQVSDLHCGFIVNVDKATTSDVLNLIKLIKETVKYKFGVELETEVKIIGEESIRG